MQNNRGGGGVSQFLPLQKGDEKVLAMLKEGTKSVMVVLTRELEVLATLKGAHRDSRGGGTEGFTLPRKGGTTKILIHNFPIL